MLDLEELKTLKSLIDKMCIQPLDYLEYRKLQYLLMKYEICYRKENGYRSLYPLCGTSFYDEKILFLSDSHKGSEYEQDKALDIAYNEALKQNIKTAINLGDIVEGTLREHGKPKNVVEEEIDNAFKSMPEEMKTWLLVGNHDYSTFRSYPELLEKFFSTRKLEILGMAKCLLFWNGATVRLNHEITQIQNGTEDLEARGDVEITGHTHVYRVDEKNRNIYLPAMVKDNQEWLEEQLKWLYTFSPTKKKVFMIGTKTSSSNILFEVYSANRGTLSEIHVSDSIEVDMNSKKLTFKRKE